MGTSSLPLHLLFWLCVVAQSSVPCACAPTFRRDAIQRDDVITPSQDPNAAASTDDAIIHVPDGDVVPERTETVHDNHAHTAKQPDDGVKNSHDGAVAHNMRKARFPASDVDAFPTLSVPLSLNFVVFSFIGHLLTTEATATLVSAFDCFHHFTSRLP